MLFLLRVFYPGCHMAGINVMAEIDVPGHAESWYGCSTLIYYVVCYLQTS